MSNELELGGRIRELRKSKGWTQGVLAQKLGINACTMSMYEINARQPSLKVFKQMCVLLETTSDYLLGLSSSKNN